MSTDVYRVGDKRVIGIADVDRDKRTAVSCKDLIPSGFNVKYSDAAKDTS